MRIELDIAPENRWLYDRLAHEAGVDVPTYLSALLNLLAAHPKAWLVALGDGDRPMHERPR